MALSEAGAAMFKKNKSVSAGQGFSLYKRKIFKSSILL